ncbi:uncharacterized protein LY79DRAFT_635028 [Colletotrichum navitas]|uniref:BTB domain-containing protein n=1 Tax=Colletotrichum navitas TaxID=681940 RepID=A0AAD8V4C6_9PEZI|nr:uncharacterized protein LY79DRAFT_635028 [Colletotrichum navitas]KAK1585594.1 hypothetical protein LY79DRAFT_635028 [Colletotrichum navitas]
MSLKRKSNMEDILKSGSIKFIIGSEKTEFTVHSMSIATLSQALHSLVSTGRPGVVVKSVTWSNVETSTFVNLMEYAYSKDYSTPELTKTDEAVEAISLHTWMLGISQEDESPQKSSAQYRFCQQHFSPNTTASDGAITESSFATEAWLKDIQQQHLTGYETVFRTHTNLYILADRWRIADLNDLCLRKIRLTLIHAPRTKELFIALFLTIPTVYNNTFDNDPLRSLLVRYCISSMACIMGQEGDNRMAPLLRRLPHFAADLLLKMPHDY